jgi:hypothetical protein
LHQTFAPEKRFRFKGQGSGAKMLNYATLPFSFAITEAVPTAVPE